MKHKKPFKLSLFSWIGGILEVIEHFVETIEEAIDSSHKHNCHSFKIYDKYGRLIRCGNGRDRYDHKHDDSPYC